MKKQFNNLNKLLLEQTDIITQELSNPNKKSTNNTNNTVKTTKSKKSKKSTTTKTTSKPKVVESKKIISEQKTKETIKPVVTTLKEEPVKKISEQKTKETIKPIASLKEEPAKKISEQKKEEVIKPVVALKEDPITKLLGQNTKEHIKTINLSQVMNNLKSVCLERDIKLTEEVKPVEMSVKGNYLDRIAAILKNIAINKEGNLKQWIFTKKYLENNFEELLQFFPKKELISDSNLQLNIKNILVSIETKGQNNKIFSLINYLNQNCNIQSKITI